MDSKQFDFSLSHVLAGALIGAIGGHFMAVGGWKKGAMLGVAVAVGAPLAQSLVNKVIPPKTAA